jgi:hypothetical protein
MTYAGLSLGGRQQRDGKGNDERFEFHAVLLWLLSEWGRMHRNETLLKCI